MEIKLKQGNDLGNGIQGRGGKIPQGATVIAKQLKKETVFIDKDGNHVNPATKQIIKHKTA